MEEQDEEKKKSGVGSASQGLGDLAGRVIGSKMGTGAASAGVKVAAGTGVRAAVAAVAGSLAPWIVAIIAAIVVFFLFFIFIVVIMGAILGLGGATPGEAAGSGLGLKDNYCQGFLSKEDYDGDGINDCSKELKTLITKAAAAAKMPAAVLNAIGLSENLGDAMVLSDQEVLDYSAAGATIPACAVSVDGAAGPMQFMPGTFEGHKNFIIEAGERPQGYSPSACNILDSLYAAAHKVKSDSGIPFDELRSNWTVPEPDTINYPYHGQSCPIESPAGTPCSPDPNPVYTAAFSYLGRCVDPAYPDSYYCENVWQFYQNKKDDTVPVSSEIAPPCGWPTTGKINTLFGEPTYVEPDGHSGVDIAADTEATINNGQDVFNTMTGTVTQSYWTDTSGGRIAVLSEVNGVRYQVSYVHVSYDATNIMTGRLNQTLSRGEAVGKTHPGALPHSTGTHLHYEVYVDGALVDPMGYTPARLNVGDTVSGPGGCP